ncbi:MAG: zinc dependent phospholipase C family protein [Bacilli bacterium]|nr:zinc dependent phospholipase C family protein [Bacilli bacterium]
MASSVIHICVAKKINETLKVNEKQLYLGSISPDISKFIGEPREKTHFITDLNSDMPNISLFLDKYKEYLDDPFVMGYLIHLYTDKLWFGEFMRNKFQDTKIRLLDGTLLEVTEQQWVNLMYSDYTNVATKLFDYYQPDLSIFYDDFERPNDIIEELQVDKLPIFIEKSGQFIMESKEDKTYIFDVKDIINFVNECNDKILKFLQNI